MGWIIIPVSLLLIIFYLLLAPFFVEIDSRNGVLLRIRFHLIASASLIFKEDSFFLLVKMAWWQKQVDMFAKRNRSKKTDVKRKKKPVPLRKIFAVIKSFRIKKLFVTIDTGDMPLNGLLYPVFYFLKFKTGKDVSINFTDENRIELQLKNNIARMMWAFIKT